ncbi:MAG: VanW family protein [Acidimicrobiales bacterium]
MRRALRIGLIGAGAVAGVAGLVVAAWAIDLRAHRDQVVRNVTLAGRRVGGASIPGLQAEVARLAETVAGAAVEIDAGASDTLGVPAGSMSLRVAPAATVDAALAVGRQGPWPARLAQWAGSFAGPRRVTVQLEVDPAQVAELLAAKDDRREPPVEPTIAFDNGAFTTVAGKPGRGIDPASVVAALPRAVSRGLPISVPVSRGLLPPRYPLEEANRVAGEAQARLATPLVLEAGTARATVARHTLAGWLTARPAGDQLTLAVDATRALPELATLLPNAGEAPVSARFGVTDGAVTITPGARGTACCDDRAAQMVEAAVRDGRSGALTLPLKAVDPGLTAARAAALGVKEPVAEFQTRHPCCAPRVSNIHRMADLVRGQVIPPGQSFSLNDFVGDRTRASGFVSAPVIENGIFSEDVGGGVSQFATTFFNAAFFAGLDFDEYQSHSIYIDRYPYGREATINFPRPDLKVRNSTPYGVLIWPTYTRTTITLTLYSTKHVEAAQTEQARAPSGACTRVTTTRTRTYPDGRVATDQVFALYRPGEGINCR